MTKKKQLHKLKLLHFTRSEYVIIISVHTQKNIIHINKNFKMV